MNKTKLGEHSSVGEELLTDVMDLEQRCRAVETAVNLEVFSLEEALTVYTVTRAEYLRYLDNVL